MQKVVLQLGPFRELLADGAPELTGLVMKQLVELLQAQPVNPVPYRPHAIGLVERFHRTWNDCVAAYMNNDEQRDWDLWVDFAVYAYNSGQHTTVKLSPNELMMGRRLRSPNELLRTENVSEVGDVTEYHRKLITTMKHSLKCAERVREQDQQSQAKYYSRRTKQLKTMKPGDRVWVFRSPREPKASKFVHQVVVRTCGPTAENEEACTAVSGDQRVSYNSLQRE
ncbi:hypothetical protein PI125_g19351 [Phytophthora idaei]|nr:hypothetical protein PI125_g19351 [Phytophthora idaei]KAG3136390.1 hypothetical protein PI126_g17843 [Phytophthora idaei]